jgi:tetratricopeptide (TPR) repeat protein
MTVDWEKVSPPGDQSALSRRALLLMQTNKHAAAAETLTRILEASPENNLARVNRAICRLLLGQLAEAKADYGRLLKDEMETFQVRFGLAEVARLEKQSSEELKQLERYMEIAPRNTAEYTNAVQRVAALRAGR